MTLCAECDFEVLDEGRYAELSEPLLIAGNSVEQVADFRRQMGLEHMSFVCVPSPGWEAYQGRGKILLLLPGDRSAAAWDAVGRWVDGEEWTFSVPPEHFDLAEAEREMAMEDEMRCESRWRWWGRAALVMAAVCGCCCWISTTREDAALAVLPWFVAGCGWAAAGVVRG